MRRYICILFAGAVSIYGALPLSAACNAENYNRFPAIVAEDVGKNERILPDYFPTDGTVVIITFTRKQGKYVAEWKEYFDTITENREQLDNVYIILLIDDVGKWIEGLIRNAFKQSFEPENYHRVLPLFINRADFAETLGIEGNPNDEPLQIVRLDASGLIEPLACGRIDEQGKSEFFRTYNRQ